MASLTISNALSKVPTVIANEYVGHATLDMMQTAIASMTVGIRYFKRIIFTSHFERSLHQRAYKPQSPSAMDADQWVSRTDTIAPAGRRNVLARPEDYQTSAAPITIGRYYDHQVLLDGYCRAGNVWKFAPAIGYLCQKRRLHASCAHSPDYPFACHRRQRCGETVDGKLGINGGSRSARPLCGDRRADSILDCPSCEVAESRCPACRPSFGRCNGGDSSATVVRRTLGLSALPPLAVDRRLGSHRRAGRRWSHRLDGRVACRSCDARLVYRKFGIVSVRTMARALSAAR